ncbi:MAG TPA: hypothetical protein DCY25_05545 [Bacteroidales bacterium]|nr:hypothetical protein [Bacteroidales bacterium]
MSLYSKTALLLFALSALLSFTAFAQEDLPAQEDLAAQKNLRKDAVKVFIDCNSCDMNFTRQEIPWVNYMRDVREAQVYVLVTRQNSGNGGDLYTYTFHGMEEYAGMDDTLVYTSNPYETSTEIRERRTNLMKAGLLRFASRTPLINEIDITHGDAIEQAEVIDKWRNWVFEISTSPEYTAEESYKRLDIRNSLRVTRITPDIKIEVDFDQSYTRQRFIEEDLDTTYLRSFERLENLFVKSLGDHWSAGMIWEIKTSTSENYDFNTMIMPSIEYDLFPYAEATHRQLRFLYGIGYQFNDYTDTTIYNMTRENLFGHQLRVAYQVQKKWGSISFSLRGMNYFHDFSKHMVAADLFTRIRLFKGLSLTLNLEAARINDQLNLRKGELSEAERLLRLREQATGYEVQTGIGLSYTFGSIYNNIVNPRFGN